MNTGIEILLKRIKDCPEDFHYDPTTDHSSKWNKLLMEALRSDVITEEEKVALRAEVTEMGRARFTERVMQALAGVDETSEDPKSLEDVIKQYRATGISSVGQTQLSSTGQSQYSNTIGLYPNGVGGNATWENREPLGRALDAQKYQTEMMRQQLDYMKIEVDRKKAK